MVIERRHRDLMTVPACLLLALNMLCACDKGQVLVDDAGQTGLAITFESGFVDSRVQTRASVYDLENYNTTMGVWGYRSDAETLSEKVFINQKVSFQTDRWTYSPAKYWMNNSTYRFYAYSPYSADRAVIDESTGMISISGITAPGTDWMVARAGQGASGTVAGRTVQFVMQHILFNKVVRVRVSNQIAADPDVISVNVTRIQVGQFQNKGSFCQKLRYTPDVDSDADMQQTEWTVDSDASLAAIEFSGSRQVGTAYTTLIDDVLIPQSLTADMSVRLEYNMVYSDGRTENFVYRELLGNIFSGLSTKYFASGNTYMISFIIGAETITFDAGSVLWNPENAGNINVE